MSNIRKTLSLLFLLLLLLAGCVGSSDHSDTLAEAEAAREAKDMGRLQIICDHILSDTVARPLSCRELCRLSMLYMEIADALPPDSAATYVAQASDLCRKAIDMSPDSVFMFFAGGSLEDVAKSQMLINITGAQSVPVDSIRDFDDYNDSIDYERR